MARRFEGDQLVIASHNKGKVREIADLLRPFNVQVFSATDLDLPEPEETGYTFLANAELKARAAATGANMPALADDSGLAVAVLEGAPGIYSARWGGKNKNFDLAMNRVHRALIGKSDKSAAFICALALAWPDGHVESFEGRVEGHIVEPGRGENGFGYDAIFQAVGQNLTFGEMDPDEKHTISHRADAFNQLVKACFSK
ncbi:MAG: RdgB/HAM1 family non-canonical purine NTP pyrophosphatase [Alphaproteobacteria bacterium]|nr:RdgB/HAM1 family non-canonical purine NTP pyrophosphatase [Alphaproteobacteria bacterium]